MSIIKIRVKSGSDEIEIQFPEGKTTSIEVKKPDKSTTTRFTPIYVVEQLVIQINKLK